MGGFTRRNMLRGSAGVAAGGLAAVHGVLGPGAGTAAAAGGEGRPGSRARDRYPFLEGVFAPVGEEVTAYDLPVTGRIPRELDGRYLRTGPHVLGLEDPRAHHWMLGEGMVHGVRLRDGRAEWYRNRWIRSAGVAARLGEPYPCGRPRREGRPDHAHPGGGQPDDARLRAHRAVRRRLRHPGRVRRGRHPGRRTTPAGAQRTW
ncbi:carotenoid cleavage dioxygenase [Actinacidiphila rubida]|uniref:Dioxygenase n=1 Tax=Actinacidiphila rubida TaxID=310780 RepID=A0A1H8LH86_9ACTN|nr:carotenoid cleavage dioxygenase [Actinacidiphila rubida]